MPKHCIDQSAHPLRALLTGPRNHNRFRARGVYTDVGEINIYKLGGKVLHSASGSNNIPDLSERFVSKMGAHRRDIIVVSAYGSDTEARRLRASESGIRPESTIPAKSEYSELAQRVRESYGDQGNLAAFSSNWATNQQTPTDNIVGSMSLIEFNVLSSVMADYHRAMDCFLLLGEQDSAILMEQAIAAVIKRHELGFNASSITFRQRTFPIIAEPGQYGNADISWADSLQHTVYMLMEHNKNNALILPGFGGKVLRPHKCAELATFGKGGSDYTATVVALVVATILFWQRIFLESAKLSELDAKLKSMEPDKLIGLRELVAPVTLKLVKDTGGVFQADPKKSEHATPIDSIPLGELAGVPGIDQLIQAKAREALLKHWTPHLNFNVMVVGMDSLDTPGTIITRT